MQQHFHTMSELLDSNNDGLLAAILQEEAPESVEAQEEPKTE